MYCHNCGKSNLKDSKFCQRCGIKLRAGVSTSSKTVVNKETKDERSTFNTKNLKWSIIGGITIAMVAIICSVYATFNLNKDPNLSFVKTFFSTKEVQAETAENVNEKDFVSTTDYWIEYTDADKTFSASFPIQPSREIDTTGNYPYYSYVSEVSELLMYEMHVVTYDDHVDTSDTVTLRSNILNSIITSHEYYELVYSKNVTFQGYPAKDFVIKKGDDTIRGKIVVANKRVYTFSAKYKTVDGIPMKYSQFVDSIVLL